MRGMRVFRIDESESRVTPIGAGFLNPLHPVRLHQPRHSIHCNADQRGLAGRKAVGVSLSLNLRHSLIRCLFAGCVIVGDLQLHNIMMVILDNLNIAAPVVAVVFGNCR